MSGKPKIIKISIYTIAERDFQLNRELIKSQTSFLSVHF